MCNSLTNPRLTMSRLRSGSRTAFSAVRTLVCSTCISQRISYTRGAVGWAPPHDAPRVTHMAESSPDRGVMIVLAYLWPLALVPLLIEKNDAEVQWHAKHGIVLMVAELIAIFAYAMFTTFVSLATFGFGCVLGVLMVFGWVGILALHIIAILKGVNGTRLMVPGISQYTSRF